MINYRDQLYAFPRTGQAERYDPVVNNWSTLDLSASTKVAVVRGEIYAMEVNRMKKCTIKRYDFERCSWQTVLSSQEDCRLETCLIAAGNHLYVCGGLLASSYWPSAKVERFDTVENKWETIANMQEKRKNAFGVATEGKIFVAGVVPSCEMYNISTDEWHLIGSLNVFREYGSMVCGTYFGESELSVECYDPTEDKWIKKTTIPVKMISEDSKNSFSGCVLKLSKGILDKLAVIKK